MPRSETRHGSVSPRARARRATLDRVIAPARAHWPFVAIMALAVALRVAATVAYRPILFVADSTDYVFMAASGSPIAFSSSGHPSGYPLFLDVASGGLESLLTVAVAQHLAGLATGTLVYVALIRFGVGKTVATAAAALLLIDSVAVALEQHVATEALFTFLLTVAAFAVVVFERPPRLRWVALGGVALAGAVTVRPGALFAVPFLFAYLVLAHRSWRAVAVGAAAIAIPLAVYSIAHGRATGWYGLTESDGWLLYGRVARLADCDGAHIPESTRPLCDAEPLGNPLEYVWTDRSPARKLFGPHWEGSPESRKRENRQLRAFAIGVVRDHPWLYVRMVGDDVLRIMRPGYPVIPPSSFPEGAWDPGVVASLRASNFPSYRAPYHAPARALRAYQKWGHVPRLLLGILALLGIGALAAAALSVVSRGRVAMPRRAAEILLLSGMGVAVFIGSVGTSNGDQRYLLTQSPLLIAGGILAMAAVYARFAPSGGDAVRGVEPSRSGAA